MMGVEELRPYVAIGYGSAAAIGLLLYAVLALAIWRDQTPYSELGFYRCPWIYFNVLQKSSKFYTSIILKMDLIFNKVWNCVLYVIKVKTNVVLFDLVWDFELFCRIVLHLGVADVGLLAGNLLVVVPLTVAGYDVIPELVQVHAYRLLVLFWYGLFFSTFLIAFGRFAIFVLPNLYTCLFEGKISHLAGLIAWMLAFVHTILRDFLTCIYEYDYDNFHFTTAYCKKNLSSAGEVYVQYVGNLNRYGPFVMLALYLATAVYLSCHFKNRTLTSFHKRELLIMIQGFLICGVCLCATWGYWGFVKVVHNRSLAPILVMLSLYVNSMINPTIFFIFNSQVQESVRKLFQGLDLAPSTNRVSPVVPITIRSSNTRRSTQRTSLRIL